MWIQAPSPLLPSQGWRRVVSICSVVVPAWLPGIVRGGDLGETGAHVLSAQERLPWRQGHRQVWPLLALPEVTGPAGVGMGSNNIR